MLTVLTANSQAGGFTIANSLRFRASASAYLNRTPASASNRTTWTWSGWVKRGGLGAAQSVLFFADSTTSNYAGILFASDVIEFVNRPTAGINARLITTQVFRDPSAWYHIVGVWDSSNATSGDRVRLYVNGTRVTAFSTATYPSINTTSIVNTATAHEHGSYVAANGGTPAAFFDGYLTEVNFIDGQALTPSSFGEIDSTTGVWKAKRYTGTYGTNGFKLNFSNGTSTTTLGYDSSGNGNNWTTNNISLTSGVTYDSMWDSPTSYDDGNNGVGNYCTWNPLSGTSGTTANGNLYFYGPGSYASRIGTLALPTSGKWYYEVTITVAPYTPRGSTTAYNWIGVAYTTNFNVSTTPGVTNVNGVMLGDNGYINNFASASSDAGITFALNDVIGIAIDTGANTYAFYKNNSSVASGTLNMTAGTSLSPMHLSYDASNGAMQANFGQRPFAYTPPTGFKALNTQNLPAVSIANGANHMAATLYTGNGGTQSVSNAANSVSFQPDFVWLKSRSTTYNNALFDSVRGVNRVLISNSTNAEGVETGGSLSAFTSSGFTLASGTPTYAAVNVSLEPYIGWQWKAGGTAVTNTAGSITSSVSANTTSGFSVVTWTAPSSGAPTVGHGLGVTPAMIFVKDRSVSGNYWITWHQSFASLTQGYLVLNATSAYSTSINAWNNTAPTSTYFSTPIINTGPQNSGSNMVAYCFAAIPGYSAFGSYTGNGSSDGPFVYCGFRPRFVLFKRTDSTGTWFMFDTSRGAYNIMGPELYANLSDAESTASRLDFLSNGFKMRAANAGDNASGGTYIYAAFCEVPMNFALAR